MIRAGAPGVRIVATVLMGWELGGGLGHVSVLVDVARRLAEHGHEPVLAVKDLVGPLALLKGVPFPVLQAPLWTGDLIPGFRASSYADILAARGFDDPDGLGMVVSAWQRLIDLTGAAGVVVDAAPALELAAYRALPVVSVENGFHSPPVEGWAFPVLDPAAWPIASPERLLAVVREVQRRRGRAAPESLPALFGGARRFVHTYPELDPCRAVRREPAAGPLHRLAAPVPSPGGASYFAYLAADYPGVDLLLPHLAAAGFRGAAYIRNASPALVETARTVGVEVHDSPPPWDEVLPRAAVVIHHASLGAAEGALAAGRPHVLLPRHLEHELTAQALEDLGVGVALKGRLTVQDVEGAVRRALTGPAYTDRAMALARTLRERAPGESLTRITECCLSLLP